MEEGGLPAKSFTVQRGKPCIYVKWRPKRNPIGSKCLNQCTNENPTRLKIENSAAEVVLTDGWRRWLAEKKKS